MNVRKLAFLLGGLVLARVASSALAGILITFTVALFVPSVTLSAVLFGKVWLAVLALRYTLSPIVNSRPSEKFAGEVHDMVRDIFKRYIESSTKETVKSYENVYTDKDN